MATPMIKKRCLLWDWTNTAQIPTAMDSIDFSNSALSSVANWNTWTPPELRGRAPFRPTVRTPAQLEGDEWKNLLASIDAGAGGGGGDVIVHFYNEPERAGVDAQSAARAWTEKMLPLREAKGVKLVAPSCASDDAGTKWLEEFMGLVMPTSAAATAATTTTTTAAAAAAPPTGPDFLGLHYYGADTGSGAIQYLSGMHAKYASLPVMVSEMACTSRSRDDVFAFTARTANWMDETEWVHEYAFFGCMRAVADAFVSPEAQLMDTEGKLTELGRNVVGEAPMK